MSLQARNIVRRSSLAWTGGEVVVGFVAGVEYFLSRNLSVDFYFGLPFAITVTPKALFNMGIAGNVMAGFHYYF